MTQFFTPDEVCTYLRIQRATLDNWRYRHVGPPYIRLHGSILYREEDIDKYLMENVVKPKKEEKG